MKGRRGAFAACAVIFASLALASATAWHALPLVPVMLFGALFCALALFERGRYRSRPTAAASAWRPTGERFFDPTTGVATEVFYDPVTGARDYRTGASRP